MKRMAALLIGFMLLVSCASSGKTKTEESTQAKTGFLYGYYERLEPGPPGGAKMRWLKPGVDFTKYDKVMLESVIFFFADDSQYKGIDGNEMKELADAFDLELVKALQDNQFTLVSEPGPDVVRLRIAITRLEQSRPGRSVVSTVLPIGLGISVVKKGATGAWTGSGATSAELLSFDSMTDEVIAAAQDERTAGFTGRYSKWGSAKEAFRYWAEKIATFSKRTTSEKQ